MLGIKEKLRKGVVELSEIDQILEDKYQAMKHVRAGMKRKMIMPSSQANLIRKSPRKHLKDVVGTVESSDIKQQIVPTRKTTKIRAKKAKMSTKKTKGDSKGKGHKDMPKIKCLNFGEYGHFAHDCPKAYNNASIAQVSEQNKKVENMLDFGQY